MCCFVLYFIVHKASISGEYVCNEVGIHCEMKQLKTHLKVKIAEVPFFLARLATSARSAIFGYISDTI